MDMRKALEGNPINELTELQAKFFLMKDLVITSDINCMTQFRADVYDTITSNIEIRTALRVAVSERLKRGIEDGKA